MPDQWLRRVRWLRQHPVTGASFLLPAPLLGLWAASWKLALLLSVAQVAPIIFIIVVLWDPPLERLITLREVESAARKRCLSSPPPSTRRGDDASSIDAGKFYEEYHSHRISDLSAAHKALRAAGAQRFVYLMGDSTLDNKHWLFSPFKSKRAQVNSSEAWPAVGEAVNGYETFLQPPRMVKDVCYWMNKGACERLGSAQVCTLMTAVEESTIRDRSNGLLLQDEFIRDHLTQQDTVIISLGGNDVALRPSLRTALSMFVLTRCPRWLIASGIAPGFGYFVQLFRDQLLELVLRVTDRVRPKTVVVCMLYYMDETAGGSWADDTLRILGYDSDPSIVQLIIRTLFETIEAKGFDIPGSTVRLMPLYTVLDGKNTADYCQRVEPSVQGGEKMADALLDLVLTE